MMPGKYGDFMGILENIFFSDDRRNTRRCGNGRRLYNSFAPHRGVHYLDVRGQKQRPQPPT
jgi:hypothetical protein